MHAPLKGRRLVALGGGGATHGLDQRLDDFVLAQLDRGRPRLGYLGWARPDRPERLRRLGARYEACGGVVEALADMPTPAQAARWVVRQDLVYVGGGDTLLLLLRLRESGLGDLLAQAARDGLLLVGVSAGASVWFEGALSDAGGQGLRPLQGLGLFPGSFCPHHDSEPARQPAFAAAVAAGALPPGLAVDDGAAVLVTAAGPQAVCSARPGAGAQQVPAAVHPLPVWQG